MKKKITKKAEDASLFFKKNFWKFFAGFVLLIALSWMFNVPITTIILIIFLVLMASFSTFYFNYASAPINFELVKLAAIAVAYTQGAFLGIIVGVSSTIASKALIGRMDEKIAFSATAISIIALLAHIFNEVDFVLLGIILVGIYNVVMFFMSMVAGGDLGWNLPYEGTNFIINAMLFAILGPILLPILSG